MTLSLVSLVPPGASDVWSTNKTIEAVLHEAGQLSRPNAMSASSPLEHTAASQSF